MTRPGMVTYPSLYDDGARSDPVSRVPGPISAGAGGLVRCGWFSGSGTRRSATAAGPGTKAARSSSGTTQGASCNPECGPRLHCRRHGGSSAFTFPSTAITGSSRCSQALGAHGSALRIIASLAPQGGALQIPLPSSAPTSSSPNTSTHKSIRRLTST